MTGFFRNATRLPFNSTLCAVTIAFLSHWSNSVHNKRAISAPICQNQPPDTIERSWSLNGCICACVVVSVISTWKVSDVVLAATLNAIDDKTAGSYYLGSEAVNASKEEGVYEEDWGGDTV